MHALRGILIVVGLFALLMGLLWIGQGLGIIRWPAESFMIDQRPWVMWGGVLVVIGAGLMFLARRIR